MPMSALRNAQATAEVMDSSARTSVSGVRVLRDSRTMKSTGVLSTIRCGGSSAGNARKTNPTATQKQANFAPASFAPNAIPTQIRNTSAAKTGK